MITWSEEEMKECATSNQTIGPADRAVTSRLHVLTIRMILTGLLLSFGIREIATQYLLPTSKYN
jgi:hypothetical protein